MRYASRFNAVEINSSFHRPHRQTTYLRWADSVPDGFAFSVKLPRRITHDLRLVGALDALEQFAGEVSGLGAKLGCVLIQLPPSLVFDGAVAKAFLEGVREHIAALAVIEARHVTWFSDDATSLLTTMEIGRVHADPPAVPLAVVDTVPIRYHRMHGSPRIYYSKYDEGILAELASDLVATSAAGAPAWCIFDNTTLGHATSDALAVQRLLRDAHPALMP